VEEYLLNCDCLNPRKLGIRERRLIIIKKQLMKILVAQAGEWLF
jgi:hypothetical protein